MSINRVLFSLILMAVLSGCGKEEGTSTSAAPVDNARLTPVVDPLAPRYEVTLAQGVDFKKNGYPNFLAEVSGVSGREDLGRWSDGSSVKFKFKQPLPEKFVLLLEAGAFGPNAGSTITVKAGTIERQFTAENVPAVHSLSFEGVSGSDSIELAIPKTTRPKDADSKSEDVRDIGIALISLKIQ